MKTAQQGFTLIELVMVIVILGILAATAIPKFIDLQTDAAEASANGVYGAAQSTAAINFAGNLLNKSGVSAISTAQNLLDAMDAAPSECSASSTTLTCTFSSTGYSMDITAETTSTPAKITKNW